MQRQTQATTTGLDGVLNGDPKTWRLGLPSRRMAEVGDVADLVVFPLSTARHITMENIVIDGGATLGTRSLARAGRRSAQHALEDQQVSACGLQGVIARFDIGRVGVAGACR